MCRWLRSLIPAPDRRDRIGAAAAAAAGARWIPKGGGWDAAAYRGRLHYRDYRTERSICRSRGCLAHIRRPMPRSPSPPIRHQEADWHSLRPRLRAAMGWADWPARLQRLAVRAAHRSAAVSGSECWLDGGHNPFRRACGRGLLPYRSDRRSAIPHRPRPAWRRRTRWACSSRSPGRSLTLHAGSCARPSPLQTPAALVAAMARAATLPAIEAADVAAALRLDYARHADRIPTAAGTVLVMGSLYLAGSGARREWPTA